MRKVARFLCLSIFVASLTACATPSEPLPFLKDEIFEPEESYDGPIETVGELTQAFARNTTALNKANNKLTTICIAAKRCEKQE